MTRQHSNLLKAGRELSCSLCLLIGGRGTRLGGVDKSRLTLESGATSGEALLRTFSPRVVEAFLVGRDEQRNHPLSRSLPFVADAVPDQGPLRAISSALHAARTPWVFVVACDMVDLVAHDLAALAAARQRGRLVIAWRSATGTEPLCALYHRALVSIADGLLARGERRARALLHGAHFLDRAAALGNINTSEELTTLRARLPT